MANQVDWKDATPEQKMGAYVVMGIVGVIVLFILIAIIGAFTGGDSSADTNNSSVTVQEEKEEEPVEALELEVRQNIFGLTIANKEDAELKNCEAQINPGVFDTGYNTRVDTIGSEATLIRYADMTKGGERFDYDKMAVERVVVTMCNEEDRIGVYEF